MTKSTDWEHLSLFQDSKFARVFSPSNIALAKYWGKRDLRLNLPTNGSISVSLKDYGSFTTAEFNSRFTEDQLFLNGRDESATKLSKVSNVLDDLRIKAKTKIRARIQSFNNFPTGAGLASSASGLSAVASAGSLALGLDLSKEELSEVARKGSGSACRSFFGGFVEWKRGELTDGTDSIAHPLASVEHWPLKILIAVVNQNQKHHASTGGMEHTRKTSPFFNAWVEFAQSSLTQFRAAIETKNFQILAELSESSCLRMHSSAIAANPPVFYWQAETIEIMHRVWNLRASGLPVFFTIDAGPNVVVFYEDVAATKLIEALQSVAGVQLLKTEVGNGTRLFDEQEWQGEP